MSAALHEQDALCRILGRCRHGDVIDRELGDLVDDRGILEPRLFTYVSYNAELTRGALDARGLDTVDPEHVQQLDSVDHMPEMKRVGEAAAARDVLTRHFAGFPPSL